MSKVDYRCLTLSAGNGRRVMDQELGAYRRVYRVNVKSDATGIRKQFTFHDSVHNEQSGKVGLSSNELLYVWYCVLTDAMAGEGSFADFCEDFGYDDDSLAAHRTWNACKQSARKVRALFHNEPDSADMVNELVEMGVG